MWSALRWLTPNVLRYVVCKRRRWASQKRGRRLARSCLARDTWLKDFLDDLPSAGSRAYHHLLRYFVAGFVTYRSPMGAYADYVGMASYNGPLMDCLEGFSRIAPLIAAWLSGGRPRQIDLDGKREDLLALLRTGLVNGTDPASTEYWGPITHWSQSIVEAADLALVLWLTRDSLWTELDPSEHRRITDWLNQVNHKHIPDNNWHLFIVQVNAVMAALDKSYDAEEMMIHYRRAKSFYRGGGWFRDGEREGTPGFDYYNAWGFHYHLQWIRRILPDLDAEFIDEAFREFVRDYRFLIGPEGFPIMGRSACYRMGVSAPLIQAQDLHSDLVPPGMARRALDTIWSYFIRNGALQNGNVTQGYFESDPRLLENYSGPASCLWSLRSLIPAFALPDNHPFWQAAHEPLFVERGDFQLTLSTPGWSVNGNQATCNITLHTGRKDNPVLAQQGWLARLGELFTCRPRRPYNIPAKYHRSCYESAAPYGLPGRTRARTYQI